MKATVNSQKIEGFFGQKLENGNRWLFVKGQSGRSYSVAMVNVNNEIIKYDSQPAIRAGSNEEIAAALLAAA